MTTSSSSATQTPSTAESSGTKTLSPRPSRRCRELIQSYLEDQGVTTTIQDDSDVAALDITEDDIQMAFKHSPKLRELLLRPPLKLLTKETSSQQKNLSAAAVAADDSSDSDPINCNTPCNSASVSAQPSRDQLAPKKKSKPIRTTLKTVS